MGLPPTAGMKTENKTTKLKEDVDSSVAAVLYTTEVGKCDRPICWLPQVDFASPLFFLFNTHTHRERERQWNTLRCNRLLLQSFFFLSGPELNVNDKLDLFLPYMLEPLCVQKMKQVVSFAICFVRPCTFTVAYVKDDVTSIGIWSSIQSKRRMMPLHFHASKY